jgi:hypothetical protein
MAQELIVKEIKMLNLRKNLLKSKNGIHHIQQWNICVNTCISWIFRYTWIEQLLPLHVTLVLVCLVYMEWFA